MRNYRRNQNSAPVLRLLWSSFLFVIQAEGDGDLRGDATDYQRCYPGYHWTDICKCLGGGHHWLTPQGRPLPTMLPGFREYSQRLRFHLLLRQACENNLLQPDLFVDFPLLFLKTRTKELCLVNSHPVPEKVRRRVDPGCFAEMLLLLLRGLLVVFRASFA